MNTSTLAALPTFLLLAACGGSGAPVTSGPLSVDEVGALVLNLGDDIAVESDADNFTPASAVPSSSTFEYEGFIAIGQTTSPAVDPTSAIGTVALEIDLASNQISGSATNFFDQGATPLVGTIPLANGTLVRSNLGVAAPAIQGLEFQSTGSNPLTRNGDPYGWGLITINGSMFGSSGEYISGTGTRNVQVEGASVEITAAIGGEKQ